MIASPHVLALCILKSAAIGRPPLSHCLRDDLGEFDQIAGRVREEGKLAADGVEFERHAKKRTFAKAYGANVRL